MKNGVIYKLLQHQKQISFDDGLHEYKVEGEKYESVTGRISFFESHVDFQEIADKLAKRNTQKYSGLNGDEIMAGWKINGDKAAAKGRAVHKAAELIAAGLIDEVEVTKEISGYIEQIIKFFIDNKVEPLLSEVIVYDKKAKVAGTIDLITINKDGSLSLWDWKTNKDEIKTTNKYNDFFNYPLAHVPSTKYGGYSLQLQTYKYMLEQIGFKVKDTNLIYITDSYYKIIPTLTLKEEAKIVLYHNFD